MITEYKRDSNNNYMVLSDEALMCEDYKMKMLVSNKIPTLLKCSLKKFDGRSKLFYEITSKQTMLRVFEKKTIGSKELINIVTSFSRAIKSCREYLLDINDFILDPEYIYINMEASEIYFCYMPGFSQDVQKSFNELCAYILERIEHNDKRAVATSYELYRNTLIDNYSINKVLAEVKFEQYEDEDDIQPPERDDFEKDIPISKVSHEYVKENTIQTDKKTKIPLFIMGGITISAAVIFLVFYIWNNYTIFQKLNLSSELLIKLGGILVVTAAIILLIIVNIRKDKNQNKKIEEDSIVILEDKRNEKIDSLSNRTILREEEECGSTVLLACRETKKRLISIKDMYSSFEINEDSFLIGKLEEYVDGVISDEMISRIHAKIFKNQDKYFLLDLNSTNGTYHNGKRLDTNESVELKSEDTIRFARAEYVFR